MKNSIKLFLLSLFMPVLFLTAQNSKETKACLQEGKIYYTPQLAGSNPAVKPAVEKMSFQNVGKKSQVNTGIRSSKKSSSSMSWPQLKSYIDASQQQLNDVTVYSGILDQRAPQIVSDGTEMFIAFESYDTQSGFYPYGTVEIYYSNDGGTYWYFFSNMDHSSYHLSSPQITIVGDYIVVTCQYAGLLYTARWKRSDLTFYPVNVPSPAVSANEYIIGHKMTTDFQEYFGTPYIYIASIFKQADGKNKILLSISRDTAYTWEPYISLGLSQSELNAASVGLDFSSSGLFLAYLGTDTSAGSILFRKSTDFGSTWTPEIKLPMFFNGGPNKKVGPMISAIGSRIAVIYQYDYYGDATDWKTGSDFDIYAVVSTDGGGSWEERMVNSTFSSEILPGVTNDYDENFYVSYIRDGRVRISMAGQEYAFGAADSSSIANASLDDFPSVFGSPVPFNNTAYTTWTEISNSSGLDILGAETTLKIPPTSPTSLTSNVTSNTEIKLTWTDNSSDESGFAIYFRQAGTADFFEKKGTVGANVATFTATGLTPSMGYEFYVRAFNTNGYSLRTNIETAITHGGSTNGLVAYYPFNGNANDESGNGNNGTNNGATLTTDRFGNANSAYSFNGTNSQMQISDNDLLDLITNFTISFWFQPKPGTTDAYILLSKHQLSVNADGSWFVRYEPISHRISFENLSPLSVSQIVAKSSVFTDQWHHVAVTYEKSSSLFNFYIDGNSDTTLIKALDIRNIALQLIIGNQTSDNSAHFFKGLMDDIRFYNQVLNNVEINDLYHEGGWNSTAAPAAPRNLTATPGNGRVTLTWNKNLESDFLKYRIYIGTIISSSMTLRDSTSGGPSDTTKTITGLTNGTAYSFRITAVNNAGAESGFSNSADATPTAPTDLTPPIITLNSPTGTPVIVNANGQVGTTPQVSATAADGESGVYQMQVAYRNTSEQAWSYSARVNASTVNYAIPTAAFVLNNKPIGVNYRVGAWDNAGNIAWSPYASIDVKLAPQAADQPSFTMPAASTLDNKTTAYRIVSVPYNLTNKQPANLLTGFGSHSENNVSYARWRFQRYVGTQYQDYDQFSTENAITPGAAFFFIVRDQGSQITVQGESIVRSDIMYNNGISMQNGWNIVGNPFTIPYPIDSLEFYNASSVRAPIRQHAFYDGAGPVSGWDTASAAVHHIQPWSGVALFVNSAGTLKFPSTGQSSGLPKTSIQQMEKVNAVVWTLAVNAYRTDINMRCEGSSLGMAQGAEEGDDPYDSYMPPIVGDKNVVIYFKNADGAMMRDIRPMNDEGSAWEMRVVTGDANARVKLQWSEKLNLPNPAFEAYLIDTDLKAAHNLKETQSLEVNSGNGVRTFRVVLGKKSYVEENNAGVALTPLSMKLYANYPNPFNPETVIRYNIPVAPESYMVTLKVFNVLGQEIAALVNEQKMPGYYEVKFNGMNQSSGIYFYQITITGGSKTFRDIKKMVLMK